ncbi:MAG: protein translocase subunit SecD [Bacillota bacterium]|nr:protein translocase subunit SecD [Bacillota bacterium]
MKKRSGVKVLLVLIVIAAATVLSVSPLVNNINLGLDLQGGAQVVLQAVPDDGETLTAEDMSQLVSVLDQRVNELGVSEPIIQVEGTDRIIVELAGVDNPESAIELIGKTAKLEFRDPNGEVILTGANLKDAYAIIDQMATSAMTQNQVILEFDSEGADLFFEATAAFTGQLISIYLDDEEIQSAIVNGPISGGSASISGGFATFQEASNLAALLRGGALPVDLEIMSKSTVGPTLGADSLSKSLNAAAIGFVVLFLFMLVYYRLPGGWACCSLLVYALLLMWSLFFINATLTLTSIAGFILSVGVAVDSNIIIYERIREELYHGKSLKASIESGFKRALWTILDSNITTLIAALVLYFFGSGTIKGFALTLAIGLVASMFTAITFTRYMLRWTSDVSFLSSKKLYGM